MLNNTSRRDFMKSAGLGAMTAGIAGCSGGTDTGQPDAKQPNIIVMMADDMGYSDIGCYGGEVDTPNIDKLAGGGVRFTQFYNTARCCPTRAALLTGLYQHQAGIGHMVDDRGFDSYSGDLNDKCMTMAEVMKTAGYHTYLSGKWHVTKHIGHWSGNEEYTSKHNWPRQRGFDRFFGTITGCGSFYDPVTLVRENEPIQPDSDDFFYTDAISDTAVDYITEHKTDTPDDPFFMYVAYTSPHWPLHAVPEDIEKYKGTFDMGWDKLREERLKRMIDMGIIDPKWALSARDKNVPEWDKAENKEWELRRMETYAAMIDCMDRGIGRIVESLEQTGQLDNTLILFLADNGGCAEDLGPNSKALYIPTETLDGRPVFPGNRTNIMAGADDTYQSYAIPWANVSNTPFRRYKHWVHEGGISSPLIAHWPDRIKPDGEFREQPGHLIDIMATCVDIAGAEYPSENKGVPIHPMEGVSLVPAFDQQPLGRDIIYWEHEGNRAIRKGDWKLVMRHNQDWELFDLKEDRTEQNDLAGENYELVEDLTALWQAWADRCGVQPWEEVQKGRRR
jgi:arylsulfatase A-like enzyme